MAEKKYYWLKLKRDFFKRHDIRIIESMPNGKDYILLYLKLLLESVDHEGTLRFSDTIPYNEEMLGVITNTNIDIVRSAMKIFTELNMIDVFDDKTIYMSEVEKLIGSESSSAERMRRLRQKKTIPSLCDSDVRKSDIEIEIDIDKDIETDSEVEKEDASPAPPPKTVRHKYGMYQNVLLSDEDYQKLQAEFPHDYSERIERLSEYIASTGKKYKSHLATIRAWARKDTTQKKGKSSNPFYEMLQEENEYEN